MGKKKPQVALSFSGTAVSFDNIIRYLVSKFLMTTRVFPSPIARTYLSCFGLGCYRPPWKSFSRHRVQINDNTEELTINLPHRP